MATPVGPLVGSFPHNAIGKVDIGVEIVLLTLCYIIVGLRVWSRHIQRAELQLNDWLIFISLISSSFSPYTFILIILLLLTLW